MRMKIKDVVPKISLQVYHLQGAKHVSFKTNCKIYLWQFVFKLAYLAL